MDGWNFKHLASDVSRTSIKAKINTTSCHSIQQSLIFVIKVMWYGGCLIDALQFCMKPGYHIMQVEAYRCPCTDVGFNWYIVLFLHHLTSGFLFKRCGNTFVISLLVSRLCWKTQSDLSPKKNLNQRFQNKVIVKLSASECHLFFSYVSQINLHYNSYCCDELSHFYIGANCSHFQ